MKPIILFYIIVIPLFLISGCEDDGGIHPVPNLKPYEGVFQCITSTNSYFPDSMEPDTVFLRVVADTFSPYTLQVLDLFGDTNGPVKHKYLVDYVAAGSFSRKEQGCSHCYKNTNLFYHSLDSITFYYSSTYATVGPEINCTGNRVK